MEHPCPVQSAPCPHLESPENSFKLLESDIWGLYDLKIYFTVLKFLFACGHNLNSLLKYGAPLPGTVRPWLISWILMICDSWLVCQISVLWHVWKCIKNTCPWCPYLEDINGSGLVIKCETWPVCRISALLHDLKCIKNTCPWCPCLEDIDGFWPGTWRIGSSLMSWITMKCHSWLVVQISAL